MTKLNLLATPSLAVSLALALAACGRSGDSRPDLLLVSARDGDYAIYVLNADGSAQTRLTENAAGRSSNGVFFQVEADWSPDGRRIVFASRRHGSFDIYVMNADGTGTRRLTATSDDDDNPTWSPDGRRLAFNRAGDIYVMSADGTGIRRVTVDVDPQTDPAWSPDGKWIAYVRGSQGTVGVDLRELWLVQPDGKRNHALTTIGVSSYSPAWSPDSTRVAFASNVESTQFDIYTIGVDGNDTQRVTASAEDTFEPAWSPDGRTIAYSEGGAIYVTDAAGKATTRITDQTNNDSSPAGPLCSRRADFYPYGCRQPITTDRHGGTSCVPVVVRSQVLQLAGFAVSSLSRAENSLCVAHQRPWNSRRTFGPRSPRATARL